MSMNSLKFVINDGTTDNKTLPRTSSYRNFFLASFASLMYMFIMGMTISYPAPATVDMKKPGSRLQNITADDITWIGSLPLLGGLPANVLAGFLTHKFGRKFILVLFSPLFTVSWLMIAYAPSVQWLFAGRIISGFCTGLFIVAVQAYVSEIAPIEIRGLLCSGFLLSCNLGILTIMGLGIKLRWTWLAISVAVVTAFTLCIMIFMPESPTWLVKKSRLPEAAIGLKFFRGKMTDTKKEIELIIKNQYQYEDKKLNFQDFRNPMFYKPLFISLCLVFFQQAVGSGPILIYTVEIFHHTSSFICPNVAATILAAALVIANIISAVFIDKFGRKKLYVISGIGTSLALAILGTYSFVIIEYSIDQHLLRYLPLICLISYAFALNIGIGTIPFIMIPEMVTIRFRSIIISISVVFLAAINFLVVKTFNDMRISIGDCGMYWTYGIVCIISVLFGYFILPETKNLTSEEISKSFVKPK